MGLRPSGAPWTHVGKPPNQTEVKCHDFPNHNVTITLDLDASTLLFFRNPRELCIEAADLEMQRERALQIDRETSELNAVLELSRKEVPILRDTEFTCVSVA